MASVRELMEYGWALAFGTGIPVQPATFNVPAGPSVTIGSNRDIQKWQQEAWRLWPLVGPLHYPTTRLSRQTSQLEWRVRVNGRELKPDAAKEEMDKVTRGLGHQEATYLLSVNDMVAGEAWYVERDGGDFAVWSVIEEELREKVDRARASGQIVRRMWQPDPMNPRRADSGVRSAIGPAVEYLTLQSLSMAQARSRISQAGVIITPAEQLYSDADPWEANLVESMTTAIKDVESPSALAPIHIRMRRDLIEFVRYITFPRPYDDLIDRKMDRAVTAIANALDIEPETLQGIGDSSYWNAWAVSMETYQAHIAPRADRIGQLYSDVAEELRRRDGQANVVVEITPNPRVMLARRSSVRDAMDAYKLYVVGPSYVRDAIGATEADAPTPEELEQMERLLGGGSQDMNRERRVGENPGPARSGDSQGARGVSTDLEVARKARKALGMKLQDSWRNTPHRYRLSGLLHDDYTCHIPLDDIGREFAIREVVGDAVRKLSVNGDATRLTSWIMETLTVPMSALQALEEADV